MIVALPGHLMLSPPGCGSLRSDRWLIGLGRDAEMGTSRPRRPAARGQRLSNCAGSVRAGSVFADSFRTGS